jgi:hypothetical protein
MRRSASHVQLSTLVARILALAAATVLLFLAAHGASLFAFPIGGGEYHAMFAHTEDGHVAEAVHAYAVHIGILACTVMLLIATGYPTWWWALAISAALLSYYYWWPVVSWEPTSERFTLVSLALLILIAPLIAGAAFAAYSLRSRIQRLLLEPGPAA